MRILADPPLADRALSAANELLAPYGITAQPVSDVSTADLLVTASAGNGGPSTFISRYWVAVTGMSNPATGLTMAQLADAVAGRITDWSSLGGDASPLRVLLTSQPAPPTGQWWPGETPSAQTASVDDIRTAIADDPHVLAILPLDAVDARVHSLSVDGVDIVFGSADGYPLVELASVVRRNAGSPELGDILDNVAIGMAGKLAAPVPTPITMRSTGDIIPARCAYARQVELGDLTHAFRELGPWLAQADITTGSVDAALSDVGVPFGCIETFSLLAPAATVAGLAGAGFDVITNATNHAKDCGQSACGDDALFDTNKNLRGAGITPVGSGADLAEARKPGIIEAKGVRFAFLGYDDIAPYYHAEPGVAGTAPLDETYVREDVAAARRQADVVIVMPHWGVEYTADPTLRQQEIAHAAIEAGAVMVIGNHPHWVQATESVGDAFIAYGLGNFIFDQDWSLETQQGMVLEAAFYGAQLKGVRFYPIHIWDEHQPLFAEPGEARQILARVWTASAALN